MANLEFVGRQATATANDATPCVCGIESLITANSEATTITDFDDGADGQILVLIAGDANTTLDHVTTDGPIILALGADRALAAGEVVQFIRVGGKWREITCTGIVPAE